MDVQAILAEGEAATTGGSLVGTLVTLFADCFGYRSDVFHHPAPSEEAGEGRAEDAQQHARGG